MLLLLLLLSHFSRVQLCAPHRRQPTRLPRPWDSPGKNTGVGCPFLPQCVKVKSESDVTQLCSTLSDPTDCSLPGSSIHGIFQARVLEWGAIAFSENNHKEVEFAGEKCHVIERSPVWHQRPCSVPNLASNLYWNFEKSFHFYSANTYGILILYQSLL